MRRAAMLAAALGTILLAALAWPARWGGSTTTVVVSGDSMRPTLSPGDVVVVRRSSSYDVGDVVVYRLPESVSPTPVHVIHRVVAVDPDGDLRLQGDNRDTRDGFGVPPSDVVGAMRLRLPRVGLAMWLLSRWWSLAAVAGAITVVAAWPTADARPRGT